MTTEPVSRCDESQLRLLLFGDEDSDPFQVASAHVESCETCRRRLTSSDEQTNGLPADVAAGGYAAALLPASSAEEVTILQSSVRASEAKFRIVEAAFEQGEVGALDLQDAQSAFEIATQRLAKVKRGYTAKERLLELDLQQAQLELDAAKSMSSEHMRVNEHAPGTIPKATVRQAELAVRIAELSVERSKTLLDLHRKPVQDPSP